MNTQQEHEFSQKIVKVLNQGALDLEANTTSRLLEIRKEALAHFQQKPVHAWAPAWATTAVVRITEPFSNNLRAGFVLLTLVASLAVFVGWQTLGPQGSEIAELDQALLTDELPINAYLDKGFESWVKRP